MGCMYRKLRLRVPRDESQVLGSSDSFIKGSEMVMVSGCSFDRCSKKEHGSRYCEKKNNGASNATKC